MRSSSLYGAEFGPVTIDFMSSKENVTTFCFVVTDAEERRRKNPCGLVELVLEADPKEDEVEETCSFVTGDVVYEQSYVLGSILK